MLFNNFDFDLKIYVTKVIFSDFLLLVKNLNGVYTILNLISHFTEKLKHNLNSTEDISTNLNKNEMKMKIKKILVKFHSLIFKNIKEISEDRFGCCFIQKYLNIAGKESSFDIVNNIFSLIKDFLTGKYSNYIIQFLITKNFTSFNKKVIEVINTNIEYYSNSNVSSHVIEIFLKNNEYCDEVIQNLLTNDREILKNILLNQYGNYGKKDKIHYFFN